MTVTLDPPVAPLAARRRRWHPVAVVAALVAAVALVAVVVRALPGDPPTPREFDAVWLEAGYAENERDVRIAARRLPDTLVYLPGHAITPFEDNTSDLARDGRHFAYVSSAYGLRIVTLPDPGFRVVELPGDAAHPAWSPDLRTIAVGGSRHGPGEFHLVDVASGAVRTVPYTYEGGRLSWSPDGATLALSAADGVHVVRPDGTLVRRIPGYAVPGPHAWSPDGTRLLLGSDYMGGGIVVADAATGRELFRLALPGGGDATWTADGGFVAVTRTAEVVHLDARGKVVRTEPTAYAGLSHLPFAEAVRPAA